MAGRFERLVLPHWGAYDLSTILKIPKNRAAHQLVSFGGYPGAVRFWKDPPRWENYLQHSIIEPAIGRDILQLEAVRKPPLLRQLFAIALTHPAEIISLEKIAGLLTEKGALETLSHYLNLLKEAFLVAPILTHGSEIRRRKSPPKLVVLNNTLLTNQGGDLTTLQKREPHQWGRRVENACLAHAINQGERVTYWREEP
jgi:predicted AAA+ superfamily ATPase